MSEEKEKRLVKRRVVIDMNEHQPIVTFFSGPWCGADIRAILSRIPKEYRHHQKLYRKDNLKVEEPITV